MKLWTKIFIKTALNFLKFILSLPKQNALMFDFDQYLGFLAFLTILTIGFWLMIFLVGFIPFWITGYFVDNFKMKREEKLKEKGEA